MTKTIVLSLALCAGFSSTKSALAYYEDICVSVPTNGSAPVLQSCYAATSTGPGRRSMIHADATFFLAQALGYRADVAYWIAAYSEVTDLAQYQPFDQCLNVATPTNSGASYITATYNGFVRGEGPSGGPSYHFNEAYSPAGNGQDVFHPGGPVGIYAFHFPLPGYAAGVIDDVYEGTLYNLRQWAMLTGTSAVPEPGLLCTAGFTVPTSNSTTQGVMSDFNGTTCAPTTSTASGIVPYLGVAGAGIAVKYNLGPMTLAITTDSNGNVTSRVPYTALQSYLSNTSMTTGTLWLDPAKPPVPAAIARIAHYLHSMQDRASHGTYCSDDAPHENSANDSGTYIKADGASYDLLFGETCAQQYHLEGHVQETGTGNTSLPLRDYSSLNTTIDELIVFGNAFGLANGWIANKELLPANPYGAKNAQGMSATDIANETVGTISSGKAYSGSETYTSGAATIALQQPNESMRLAQQNANLVAYGAKVKARSKSPSSFVAFQLMPGNSANPNDTSVCFK